jgi:hypothetical protein
MFERGLRDDPAFRRQVHQYYETITDCCGGVKCFPCCCPGTRDRRAYRLKEALFRVLDKRYGRSEGLRLPPHGPPLLTGDKKPHLGPSDTPQQGRGRQREMQKTEELAGVLRQIALKIFGDQELARTDQQRGKRVWDTQSVRKHPRGLTPALTDTGKDQTSPLVTRSPHSSWTQRAKLEPAAPSTSPIQTPRE